MFGGFEDLTATQKEDEEEVDELENIPADKENKRRWVFKRWVCSGRYRRRYFILIMRKMTKVMSLELVKKESDETSEDVSYENRFRTLRRKVT